MYQKRSSINQNFINTQCVMPFIVYINVNNFEHVMMCFVRIPHWFHFELFHLGIYLHHSTT
jgi:hypothetical protein